MEPIVYYIDEITDLVNGELVQQGENVIIRHLLIDSRNAVHPSDSVFFAINGVRHDGHEFIDDLYANGFRNFIVSTPPTTKLEGANVILVTDTLGALQQLAELHRQRCELTMFAITGSNGKTIVKEWLGQLFSHNLRVVTSPKSYNSQVGVPLSLWQIKREDQIGIFEAGISMPDEMQRLQKMIRPQFGVFTNIGFAHDENFESRRQKAEEKMKLFAECEGLFYCSDYEEIEAAARPLSDTCQFYTWSRKHYATLRIESIKHDENGALIRGIYKEHTADEKEARIYVPFNDLASIENAIHCWLVGLVYSIAPQGLQDFMANLQPVAMRMELLDGINECTIVNDVYSSDLGSLAIALYLIQQQNQHTKKTFILSDIFQSGMPPRALYQEMANLVSQHKPDRLIGIGSDIAQYGEMFDVEAKYFFQSTDAFLANIAEMKFDREAILLKGARDFKFERISVRLQLLAHQTVLEIDLTAAVENLNYFRTKLKPQTKLMAMVKAFSYGSGSFEIANVLEFHRVDYLAVAYADEGIELRKAGISLPIMVMNPEPQSYRSMIRTGLQPEIYSFKVLREFTKVLSHHLLDDEYSIHLKIDTGMHRLGFEEDEIDELLTFFEAHPELRIQSVFSHLTSSDEATHDDFTRSQIERFDRISSRICSELGYPILRHILNSAGILRFPDAQFDMVRLGIGLYGIGYNEEAQSNLKNVTTLKTVISQIRTVKAGETVGYSRKGKVDKEMQIATLPIGYADGLSRQLSNGKGHVSINGKLAPIVGNVCMDMVMVDITGIDAIEGDDAIVFGDEISIHEIAKTLNTIPYEILTMISRRVKRVYYRD